MPRIAKKGRSPVTELCSSNLRAALRYREMSVAELAKRVGVSSRTLEAYTAGRVSLTDAKASTVMSMARELKIDPYILVGEKPIDTFFEKEKRAEARKRKRYTTWVTKSGKE